MILYLDVVSSIPEFSIIEDNKIIFSCKISHSIKEKLSDSIIPKYISSFSGSNISGELYIGIDDYGEITGIPYYGILQKSTILNIIGSSIKEKIR